MDVDRAFPDIVRAHQDVVYSIALRLTPTSADAEDAAQDVFIRAYRALQSYDDARRNGMRFRPWLAAITVNVCRNRARGAGRRPTTTTLDDHTDQPHSARDVAAQAVDRAQASELVSALGTLPESQRRSVALHHAGGLTYAEVAEALGRPEGTVKADVHRGLQTLRAIFVSKEQPA